MPAGPHRAACVFNNRSPASTWEQRAPEGPRDQQAGTHMRYCSHHCHGMMAWHFRGQGHPLPGHEKRTTSIKTKVGEDSVSRRLIPLMFQVSRPLGGGSS